MPEGLRARIVGAAEAPYVRHPTEGSRTEHFIADAVVRALADAGISRDEVDGLSVASFSLRPDHVIDLTWKLGMKVRWLMEDTNGGASGINMLQHAIRAVEAGDATTVVIAAGDRMEMSDFHAMTDAYNQVTRDYHAPLPLNGPNAIFSFITDRFARAHDLQREDFACVALAQRAWAGKNPGAVYRDPMTLDEYMAAVPVAPPLTRYDCVPIVSGADAIVVTTDDRARRLGGSSVAVRGIRAVYNHDQQDGDGTTTGFAEIAEPLWSASDTRPDDIDAAYIYDDYPVMVLAQLLDLGVVQDSDLKRFLHATLLEQRWPLNTSGGQLSAGQAGAAGGLHGIVEAVSQLRGTAGTRQVACAETALVTGFGMVTHVHGTAHNAAVLERIG